MLTDIITAMSQFTARTLNQADPGEREKLVRTFTKLTDLGVTLLRESPEFRQAFARIHTEFLKYPESAGTIEQAISAYDNYSDREANPLRPH